MSWSAGWIYSRLVECGGEHGGQWAGYLVGRLDVVVNVVNIESACWMWWSMCGQWAGYTLYSRQVG